MFDSYFRPIYQLYLLDPLSKLIKATSPHFVSYLLCLIAFGISIAISHHFRMLAILLLLAAMLLDTLDNLLIDHQPKVLAYRILELAIIGALFTLQPIQHAAAAIILLASAYLYLSVLLLIPTETTSASFGLIGKREALVFYILMILEVHYFNFVALTFSVAILYMGALHFWKGRTLNAAKIRSDVRLA